MDVNYLTATGGKLAAGLREGRWAPWEHLQSTRRVPLYRGERLILRALFSEETSCEEVLDRLRHMIDWEFALKLQVFPAGLLVASGDPTGRATPRGGVRPHAPALPHEEVDSEDADHLIHLTLIEIALPAVPAKDVLVRVPSTTSNDQTLQEAAGRFMVPQDQIQIQRRANLGDFYQHGVGNTFPLSLT